MQSTKLIVPLLALFVPLLFPPPVQAQERAGTSGRIFEFNPPVRNGVLWFKVHLFKKKKFKSNAFIQDPENRIELDRPISMEMAIRIEIDVHEHRTPARKARAIRARILEVLEELHPKDRKSIVVKQYQDTTIHDPECDLEVETGEEHADDCTGSLTGELLICNNDGIQIVGDCIFDKYSGEIDEQSSLKDVTKWDDGSVNPPTDINPTEDKFAAVVTDGVRLTVDLSGTPEGGLIHVRVEDELLLSVDTFPYTFGPLGTQLLEQDIADLMSMHELIDVRTITEALSGVMEMEEFPFDGQCIEIVELPMQSFSFQVTDPGLVIARGCLYEPEGIVVGTKYCEATANSTGDVARIWCTRDPDPLLVSSTLALKALQVPNQFGIFFSGVNQIQVPFGDGSRCVGGNLTRLTSPKVAVENEAHAEIDTVSLPLGGSGLLNVQYWFRDSGAGHFNLSDATSVVLLPGVTPL